jgi:A/G-specific adenine glycosylase
MAPRRPEIPLVPSHDGVLALARSPSKASPTFPCVSTAPEPTSLPDLSVVAPLRTWAAALLDWFGRHQRPLPWRRDRDPYRIWISEVMLQQTQAAVVVGYFERFLKAFPTLTDLARADEQEVLRLWEGLGYYRRARDLHHSAREIVRLHSGRLPDDPDVVRRLPGFGPYTCNAVLSQAFDRRLPILEANSQRVLSRLFGRRDDPRQGPARRWLWQAAEEMLPETRVGEFNQALMELGALVCTPTAPRCGECPLAARCEAHRLGEEETIPARSPAPATIAVQEAAVVIRRDQRVLLVQRPAAGRWANLWEFPHGPLLPGENHDSAVRRLAADLTGLQIQLGPELLTFRHTVTKYLITLACFEADHVEGAFQSSFYQRELWLTPAELAGYPVSAPQRRLAKFLTRPPAQAQGALRDPGLWNTTPSG